MKEEDRVNPELFKKEFAILDTQYGNWDFSVYSNPVLAECRFFETLAWYIDLMKKKFPESWEAEVQRYIDDALAIDNIYDRYLYVAQFIASLGIEWYSAHPDEFRRNLYNDIFNACEKRYTKAKNNHETLYGLPGAGPLVPKWYWTWFDGHPLEQKVIAENRRIFIDNMRKFHEKHSSESSRAAKGE